MLVYEDYNILESGNEIVIHAKRENIRFTNCEFYDAVSIQTNRNNGNIIINNNCKFKKGLRVSGPSINSIQIQKSSILNCLNVSGHCSFVGLESNNLEKVQFQNLNIDSTTGSTIVINDSPEFNRENFKINRIVFNRSKLRNVQIGSQKSGSVHVMDDETIIDHLDFYHGIYDFIGLHEGIISKLTIGHVNNNILTNFNKITVSPNCMITDDFWLRNTVVNQLKICRINSQCGIRISEVKFKKLLDLSHANLSISSLNNVDLTTPGLITSFENSRISGAIFSNILWPKRHELNWEINDRKNRGLIKLNQAVIRREVYRQLKNIMKETSNYIDAMAFRERELTYYETQLKLGGVGIYQIERFRLAIGRLFGNHGESLVRPILIGLGFHLLFFTTATLCGEFSYNFDINNASYEITMIAVSDFIDTLNPIKEINTKNGFITFFKLIRSIVLGTCIYYALKALRKYANL